MGVLDRLRAATRPLHDAIEATPLARDLGAARVSRATYTRLLARLLAAHRFLEAELARYPTLRPALHPGVFRSDAVTRDLGALAAPATPADCPAVRGWAEAIAREAETQPEALLGAAYVFEGSRMGSRLLVGPLSQALGVPAEPGRGLDYHLEGVLDRGAGWKRFRDGLESLPLSEAQQEAVVRGAVATFHMMTTLYADGSAASG